MPRNSPVKSESIKNLHERCFRKKNAPFTGWIWQMQNKERGKK